MGEEEQGLFLELLELSMVDIFILQNLMKYTHPTLRFKILEDINNQLPKEKEFSAAKFYYALNKMVEKGYVKFTEGEKQGSALVQPTEKVRLLFEVFLSNLLYSTIDIQRIMTDLIAAFFKNSQLEKGEQTLIILESEEEMIDPHKLRAFAEFTENLYILAPDDKFQHYLERNPDTDLVQTKRVGDSIREANNYFDVVVVLEAVDKLEKEMVIEFGRILKSNGNLILSTRMPIPQTNHFLIDESLKLLQTPKERFEAKIATMEELLDLDGFGEVHEFKYHGFVLKWTIKTSE